MSAPRLIERFRASVEKFPSSVALLVPGGKQAEGTHITYAMLAERVSSLSSFLRTKGLKKGDRAAFIFPKSVDAVATLLAILDCSATYIPIDVELPPERIKLILLESDPHCLITHPGHFPSDIPCQQNEMSSLIPGFYGSVTFLPAEDEMEFTGLDAILYTSGSTGIPKGVCLSEKNISAFVNWSLETFPLSPDDVVASIAPFHFDLSTFDLFASFSVGAKVVLFGSSTTRNPKLLGQELAKSKITIIYATPSQLNVLYHFGNVEKEDLSSLKLVLFAGEIYPAQQLHLLMKMWRLAEFWNLYGPTETNVCTAYRIPSSFDELRVEPYPIGKVCPHLGWLISQDGELLITGDNVTQGYRKHKRLNEAAFFEYEGKKYYRTGDRVEEDSNGNLIYTGRIDRMIKKRGYRIEPGEIEAVLADLEGVKECAVIGEKATDGFTQLVAFLAMKKPEQEDIMMIKQFCAGKLPVYMIPDKIVFLKELPKTSSGKVDVSGLV